MTVNLRSRVREVLEQSHLMSLATHDEGGVWVADLIFISDDDSNLYWMSDPDCRHSKAIEQNPQVAGSITASVRSKEPNFGIQFSGTAERLVGPRHDLAVKHRAKRGRPAPLESEDFLQGEAWYKLTLTKLRLIDEANFGFDTKDVIGDLNV